MDSAATTLLPLQHTTPLATLGVLIVLCATICLAFFLLRIIRQLHRSDTEVLTPREPTLQEPPKYSDPTTKTPQEAPLQSLIDLLEKMGDIESEAVRIATQDLQPTEAAALIAHLPLARSNQVIRAMNQNQDQDTHRNRQTLLRATELLDDRWQADEKTIRGLLKRFRTARREAEKARAAERDFVIQSAMNCSPDDEGRVLAMVGPEDDDLRRELIKAKFLYSYLQFLPQDVLKRAFESDSLTGRAQTYVVLDERTQKRVLDCYNPDSELRRLLMAEVEAISHDDARSMQARQQRIELIKTLTERVHDILQQEPDSLEAVLAAETKARNPKLLVGLSTPQ